MAAAVMRSSSSPEAGDRGRCRDHPSVHGESCPPTLREEKPKAGSVRNGTRTRGCGLGPQTGVEARKSTHPRPRPNRLANGPLRARANERSVTPTKINRGGRGGTNGTRARFHGDVKTTRPAGANLRRAHR